MPVAGPTGENNLWKVGDYYQVSPFQHPHQLEQDEVDLLNKEIIQAREKAAAADATRMQFYLERACPKCGYNDKPAIVRYQTADAPCAPIHGTTEHLNRTCRRCHYSWAEDCIS